MTNRLLVVALISLISIAVACTCQAQDVSVRYQSIAISSRGLPLANQSVAVCTQPASTGTQPCSPLATLGTSTSTTTGGANPTTTDSNGNYFFYARPGKYTVQIYGPQVGTPFVQPDTLVSCIPAASCPFSGPSPWFDVTNTTFNAKCDGVTDDTAAFQAAITAAAAGGTIFIPPSVQCLIASSAAKALNADSSVDITIRSTSEVSGISNTARPLITFTGTPTNALSAQGAGRLTLKGIELSYTSAGFTGKLVDCTNCTSPRVDTAYLTGAGGTAKNASALFFMNGAGTSAKILYSTFGNAVNGIDLGGTNVAEIVGNIFDPSNAALSGSYIINVGQGSTIQGNTFELLNAPNTAIAIDRGASGNMFGVLISGNWFGDMPVGYTGTVTKVQAGAAFVGNAFVGQPSSTMVTDNGGQAGLVFSGNFISGTWLNGFTCDTALTMVSISGNSWSAGNFTNFNTGAGPCLLNTTTTGVVQDPTGLVTVYGSFQPPPTVFANLGTPANGLLKYCSDCTIANPCAGAGNGALAKRLNGVWVCN